MKRSTVSTLLPLDCELPTDYCFVVWDDVYGFDMSVIKSMALTEPLVDTVDASSVISNACPILDIDIATVKKEDLAFTSDFHLVFKRNDYCHALVAYFDCSFTHCHKQIAFSTGPAAKYTHWKQTVFYLDNVLTVSAGEVLEGHLKCTPNASNPRDLDIDISVKFEGANSKLDSAQEYKLR